MRRSKIGLDAAVVAINEESRFYLRRGRVVMLRSRHRRCVLVVFSAYESDWFDCGDLQPPERVFAPASSTRKDHETTNDQRRTEPASTRMQ